MEESGAQLMVYPPNKPFNRQITFSSASILYDKHLFLDFTCNGEALLGCANFGTLWESSIFYYENSESLPVGYMKGYTGHTARDAKFVKSEYIVSAEDNGTLNLLSVKTDKNYLQSVGFYRCDDPIKGLTVRHENMNIVACAGTSIVIWDIHSETNKPTNNFKNVHMAPINSVDCNKNELSTFFSASMDRKCCIWDIRKSNPASVIYENEFSALNTVTCNESNTNEIIVGTQSGDIYLIDRRQVKQFVSKVTINSIIHRICNWDKYFAICGDNNEVTILSAEDSLKSVYTNNDKHTDIVRGLAWNNKILYSCGFDGKIAKHCF